MQFVDVKSRVIKESEHKKDIAVSFRALQPHVEDDNILFLSKNHEYQLRCTNRGLRSYFALLQIPQKFYSTCGKTLRQSILREFHRKQAHTSVILRIYDNKIRYFASDRYKKFDDIDVIHSLAGLHENIVIRDFYQDDNFLRIRLTSEDPITLYNGKKFYPGVQIVNSETGQSSVRVDYFIYEEICTNGAIVVFEKFPGFKMRHVGRPNEQDLTVKAEAAIKALPEIKDLAEESLVKASRTKALVAKKLIQKSKSKVPIEKVVEMAGFYKTDEEQSALDIISGYTEFIKNFDVDDRMAHEEIAGSILQKITSR